MRHFLGMECMYYTFAVIKKKEHFWGAQNVLYNNGPARLCTKLLNSSVVIPLIFNHATERSSWVGSLEIALYKIVVIIIRIRTNVSKVNGFIQILCLIQTLVSISVEMNHLHMHKTACIMRDMYSSILMSN